MSFNFENFFNTFEMLKISRKYYKLRKWQKISKPCILVHKNGQDFEFEQNSKSCKIEDIEIREYLQNRYEKNIRFDLDQVVGIGGESILIRKRIEIEDMTRNCVIKLAPIEGRTDDALTPFFRRVGISVQTLVRSLRI